MMILAGMVLVSSEVIAAPQNSEQATDSIQSDNLGLFADWWPVPVAILALIIFFKLPDLGLRQAPLRNWSFSPFVGLFFFFVTVLGGALAAEILVALVGRPVPPDELVDDSLRGITIRMIGTYLGQGFVLCLVPGLIFGSRQFCSRDRRPFSWARSISAGVGSFVLCWPLVAVAGMITGLVVSGITGEELPEVAHQMLERLQQAALHPDLWFIVVLIALVVATPFFEELTYRGLLQESIRRLPFLTGESPWIAIIATSIIFAVVHAPVVDYRGLAALMVLSLGFGWIVIKTGRLLAAVVMHGLFNGLNLLVALN